MLALFARSIGCSIRPPARCRWPSPRLVANTATQTSLTRRIRARNRRPRESEPGQPRTRRSSPLRLRGISYRAAEDNEGHMATGGYGKARMKQRTDALRAQRLVKDQIGRSPQYPISRAPRTLAASVKPHEAIETPFRLASRKHGGAVAIVEKLRELPLRLRGFVRSLGRRSASNNFAHAILIVVS
jgi:hypothetical protein